MCVVEEMADNLFRIEVPLPDNPLRYLNAYLVRRSETQPGWRGRSLLVDSGFNRPECRDPLLEALKRLGVSLDTLDFFVTHLHSDHCGLTRDLLDMAGPDAWAFASAGDGVYMNKFTRQSFRLRGRFDEMLAWGMPPELVTYMTTEHPGVSFAMSRVCPFTPVEEGDVLDYGGHALRVLRMPGHTPDLLCLYDREQRILLSSDHILGDITPNITPWPGVRDSLGGYLRSLDKAAQLDVALCLPGHRRVVADYRNRVAALQRHHAARLDEVVDILDRIGEGSAFDVASRMAWSIRAKSWEDFPTPQKHFACSEAQAHLVHLQCLGRVKCREHQGIIQYSRGVVPPQEDVP